MKVSLENLNYRQYDKQLRELDARYSFHPDEVNYFNVHRPKSLILKLQQRHALFDESVVQPIIERNFNKQVATFEVLTRAGTGHVITVVNTKDGEHIVLRTNMFLEFPEEYMEFEKYFVSHFKSLGIPVVNVYYADVSRKVYPFDYQIMDVLPGRDLGADWEGSREDYESICEQQGRYIAKLFRVPAQGWGRIKKDEKGNLYGIKSSLHEHLVTYLEHDLEVITLFGILSEHEISRIKNYFYSDTVTHILRSATSHLIHNDPSDLNMRYEGDKLVAIFDWEHAIMFDPVSELGIAPTWKSAYPKKDAMIRGFLTELGEIPEYFEERMNIYFLRKMLDKVAFALKGERLSIRHLELLREGLQRNGLSE